MNLLDFLYTGAKIIAFLIVWQLLKLALAKQFGTDNQMVKAMSFPTAG